MNNDLKNRLSLYLTHKGISVNSLVRQTGLPQPTLQKQINGDSAISTKVLIAICEIYPELSAEWLLRGEGNMLKSTSTVVNVVKQGGNGIGQTNILGDNNETSDSYAMSVLMDEIKHLREQNNKLMEKIING